MKLAYNNNDNNNINNNNNNSNNNHYNTNKEIKLEREKVHVREIDLMRERVSTCAWYAREQE